MTGLEHHLVVSYLDRVRVAAAGLPQSIQDELVLDLSAHLESSLGPGASEAEVRQALTALGSPEDVVAEAYDGVGAPEPSPASAAASGPNSGAGKVWGPVETIAVTALILGTFLLPLIGPILGVVMTWASQQWSRRGKVLTTIASIGPVTTVVVLGIASALLGDSLIYDGFLWLYLPPLYVGSLISGICLAVALSRRRSGQAVPQDG